MDHCGEGGRGVQMQPVLPAAGGSECEETMLIVQGDGDDAPLLAGSRRRRLLPIVGVAVAALVLVVAVIVRWRRPTYRSLLVPGASGGIIQDHLEPYDCNVQLADAAFDWSLHKKMWCCSHSRKGCPTDTEVRLFFVLANVVYAKAANAADNGAILHAIKNVVAKSAVAVDSKVTPGSVSAEYWEGSGLHSSLADAGNDNRGMVWHVTVVTSTADKRDAVFDHFKSGPLAYDLEQGLKDIITNRALARGVFSVKELTVEDKIVDRCTCNHGKVATGLVCPAFGGEVCSECDYGFHLTSGRVCDENVCTCPNGGEAKGIDCERHGHKGCTSCYGGFHLKDAEMSACVPNSCYCLNGTAAFGSACYFHDGEICSKCLDGFHLDHTSSTCEVNQCTCPGGRPATLENCFNHGHEICQTCDGNLGLHLDPKTRNCKQNKCICERGVAAEGKMCPMDSANVCAYCNDALLLSNDRTCGETKCVCKNGVEATGEICDTNGANACTSCNYGYHLNAQQCVDVGCMCEHGIAADEHTCPIKGSELCIQCHFGYTLQNGHCSQNVCVCENGEAAKGPHCRSPGVYSCSTCNVGFHHHLEPIVDEEGEKLTVKCEPNVCVCVDPEDKRRTVGEPATAYSHNTQICHEDGGNLCQTCFDEKGFHLDDGSKCFKNECKCQHGVPVDQSKCVKDHAENCTSTCNDGFFLAEKPLKWIKHEGMDPPADTKFDGGAKICTETVLTTTQPFDCTASQATWETAWSRIKKQWCCHNTPEGIGCIPTHTQKELCSTTAMNQQECDLVGCCRWTTSGCSPANGKGERVCHVEFNIKFRDARCFTVPEKGGKSGASQQVAYLDACDVKNAGQDWSPTATSQIEDTLGNCLHIETDAPGAAITAKVCEQGKAVSKAQKFAYDAGTLRIRSEAGNCFTVMDSKVILGMCSMSDENQIWSVPPVNPTPAVGQPTAGGSVPR